MAAMLELAVAALRRDEAPIVVVKHSQDLADLHRASLSGSGLVGTPTTPLRHDDDGGPSTARSTCDSGAGREARQGACAGRLSSSHVTRIFTNHG